MRNFAFVKMLVLVLVSVVLLTPITTMAASKSEIDSNARAALEKLYVGNPMAQALAEKAKGILVFPSILKAGFIVGVQGGNGALFKNGKTVGYYNSSAASSDFLIRTAF